MTPAQLTLLAEGEAIANGDRKPAGQQQLPPMSDADDLATFTGRL